LFKQNLGDIGYYNYSFKTYNKILTEAMRNKRRIYSAAYIMASGKSVFNYDAKHSNHLKLIELMIKNELPEKITELKSLQALFELLKSYPTIGDFLAYQLAIDINYSNLTTFSEMEFIVPGPGAIDGITKCFSDFMGYSLSDLIKYTTDVQQEEFSIRNLSFKTLFGRHLQLIDCQNLFCEVDKYSRIAHPEIKGVSGRTRIKQKYKVHSDSIEVWYPPKWGLNTKKEK
jgi:hypothetical protein